MFDTQSLIKEVAARHAIRIYEDDPCFALVTLNQVVLSATATHLQDEVRLSLAEFEHAIEKLHTTAGKLLAQQVIETRNQFREQLRVDLEEALSELREASQQSREKSERTFRQPILLHLLAGMGLFLAGLLIGEHFVR